ncbi:MAG: hypothetical protein Kow0042_06190 [Calditrichia bacterium]
MNLKKRSSRVLIVYNEPDPNADTDDSDILSEAAVKTEAQHVFQAAKKLGYQPEFLPISDILVNLNQITRIAPEVIVNLCEGYRGKAAYEMHLAALWELLNIPYTGNPPLTLGIGQNKVLSKKLFETHKIPTPSYQVYHSTPQSTYLNYPVIAKPSREDASLGITQFSITHNFIELQSRVSALLEKYNQPILVEKFIEGREFNVSILGNSPPRVLPISEIDFSQLDKKAPHITSYEAKWLPEHPYYQKTPAVCPAKIGSDLKHKLEEVALRVYTLLGGRDYGRVDIRVDRYGRIYVLEFNPNPDISMDAGFANALRAAKMKYEQFIDFIIQEAIKRKNS